MSAKCCVLWNYGIYANISFSGSSMMTDLLNNYDENFQFAMRLYRMNLTQDHHHVSFIYPSSVCGSAFNAFN